jgi:hypothetical protein
MLLASAARTGRQLGKSRVLLTAQESGSGRLTHWYQNMGFSRVGVNSRGYPQLAAPIAQLDDGRYVVARPRASAKAYPFVS